VPAGWVPPFWLAAAYAGCKPAGQREWRWLHTLQGRPCFPWDHPDTAGLAALMAQQQLQRQLALAKRPKAKQMLAAPASPPDWHDLLRFGCSGGSKAPMQGHAAEEERGAAAAEQGVPVAAGQEQPAAQQQAPDQPATAMETDGDDTAGDAKGTAAAAAVPAASPASHQQLVVARSYAAMAAALQGRSGSSDSSGSLAAAASGQQAELQWRPRQPSAAAAVSSSGSPEQASQACCLVEAAVMPIKTGIAAEGAAVCFIAGGEGWRHRTPVDVLTAR